MPAATPTSSNKKANRLGVRNLHPTSVVPPIHSNSTNKGLGSGAGAAGAAGSAASQTLPAGSSARRPLLLPLPAKKTTTLITNDGSNSGGGGGRATSKGAPPSVSSVPTVSHRPPPVSTGKGIVTTTTTKATTTTTARTKTQAAKTTATATATSARRAKHVNAKHTSKMMKHQAPTKTTTATTTTAASTTAASTTAASTTAASTKTKASSRKRTSEVAVVGPRTHAAALRATAKNIRHLRKLILRAAAATTKATKAAAATSPAMDATSTATGGGAPTAPPTRALAGGDASTAGSGAQEGGLSMTVALARAAMHVTMPGGAPYASSASHTSGRGGDHAHDDSDGMSGRGGGRYGRCVFFSEVVAEDARRAALRDINNDSGGGGGGRHGGTTDCDNGSGATNTSAAEEVSTEWNLLPATSSLLLPFPHHQFAWGNLVVPPPHDHNNTHQKEEDSEHSDAERVDEEGEHVRVDEQAGTSTATEETVGASILDVPARTTFTSTTTTTTITVDPFNDLEGSERRERWASLALLRRPRLVARHWVRAMTMAMASTTAMPAVVRGRDAVVMRTFVPPPLSYFEEEDGEEEGGTAVGNAATSITAATTFSATTAATATSPGRSPAQEGTTASPAAVSTKAVEVSSDDALRGAWRAVVKEALTVGAIAATAATAALLRRQIWSRTNPAAVLPAGTSSSPPPSSSSHHLVPQPLLLAPSVPLSELRKALEQTALRAQALHTAVLESSRSSGIPECTEGNTRRSPSCATAPPRALQTALRLLPLSLGGYGHAVIPALPVTHGGDPAVFTAAACGVLLLRGGQQGNARDSSGPTPFRAATARGTAALSNAAALAATATPFLLAPSGPLHALAPHLQAVPAPAWRLALHMLAPIAAPAAAASPLAISAAMARALWAGAGGSFLLQAVGSEGPSSVGAAALGASTTALVGAASSSSSSSLSSSQHGLLALPYERLGALHTELRQWWVVHREAERQARLRALRASDTDAYVALLSDVKVHSLLRIMETTHRFMLKVGAQLTTMAHDHQTTIMAQQQSNNQDDSSCNANDIAGRVLSAHEAARGTAGATTATTESSSKQPHHHPDEATTNEYKRFKEYVASTRDEYRLVHRHTVFVAAQPRGLDATLMPHQLAGLRFLASLHANGINGILADEMGVGKTIQTLAFLLYLKESAAGAAGGTGAGCGGESAVGSADDTAAPMVSACSTTTTTAAAASSTAAALPDFGPRRPHLVMAPLSIIREWRDACAQFVPRSMRVCEMHELEEDTASESDEEDAGEEEDEEDEPLISLINTTASKANDKKSSSDDSSSTSSSSEGTSDETDDDETDLEDSGDSDDEDGGLRRRRGPQKQQTAKAKPAQRTRFERYAAKKAKKDERNTQKSSKQQVKRQVGKNGTTSGTTRGGQPKGNHSKSSAAHQQQHRSPRRAAWERALDYDIVLVALHRVRDMSKELRTRVPWGYIVVDEAHKAVSNLHTITAQSINAIAFERRLVLTGTPLNSDLQELWSLLHFINPTVFSAKDSFDEVFRRPFEGGSGGGGAGGTGGRGKKGDRASERAVQHDASLNEEERQLLVMRMHQILRPFVLRRTKRDIDTSLRITFHEVRCPLSAPQALALALLQEQHAIPMLSEGDRAAMAAIANPSASSANKVTERDDARAGKRPRGTGDYEHESEDSDDAEDPFQHVIEAATLTKMSVTGAAAANVDKPGTTSAKKQQKEQQQQEQQRLAEERLCKARRGALAALQALGRPVHHIKNLPTGPDAHMAAGTCEMRAVTTVTTMAQGICNHAFMLPFFSRVLVRARERAVAEAVAVYRERCVRAMCLYAADAELARRREEAAAKRRQAMEERRQLKEQEEAAAAAALVTAVEKDASAAEVGRAFPDSSEAGASARITHSQQEGAPKEPLFRRDDVIVPMMPAAAAAAATAVNPAEPTDDKALVAAPEEVVEDVEPPFMLPGRSWAQLQAEDEACIRQLVLRSLDAEDSHHAAAAALTAALFPPPSQDTSTSSSSLTPRSVLCLRPAEWALRCSGKFVVLDLLLRRMRLAQKKVVLFSHWLDCIDLLQEYLDGAGWRGQYITLTGATSADERKAGVDRFRSDPSALVFIVSVKAGGCGLNLQIAHMVVMLDRDYTATNEDQAIARVFRIGQRNTVRALTLVTDHPAEQRIAVISAMKDKPREALIEGGRFNLGSKRRDEEAAAAAAATASTSKDAEDEGASLADGGGEQPAAAAAAATGGGSSDGPEVLDLSAPWRLRTTKAPHVFDRLIVTESDYKEHEQQLRKEEQQQQEHQQDTPFEGHPKEGLNDERDDGDQDNPTSHEGVGDCSDTYVATTTGPSAAAPLSSVPAVEALLRDSTVTFAPLFETFDAETPPCGGGAVPTASPPPAEVPVVFTRALLECGRPTTKREASSAHRGEGMTKRLQSFTRSVPPPHIREEAAAPRPFATNTSTAADAKKKTMVTGTTAVQPPPPLPPPPSSSGPTSASASGSASSSESATASIAPAKPATGAGSKRPRVACGAHPAAESAASGGGCDGKDKTMPVRCDGHEAVVPQPSLSSETTTTLGCSVAGEVAPPPTRTRGRPRKEPLATATTTTTDTRPPDSCSTSITSATTANTPPSLCAALRPQGASTSSSTCEGGAPATEEEDWDIRGSSGGPRGDGSRCSRTVLKEDEARPRTKGRRMVAAPSAAPGPHAAAPVAPTTDPFLPGWLPAAADACSGGRPFYTQYDGDDTEAYGVDAATTGASFSFASSYPLGRLGAAWRWPSHPEHPIQPATPATPNPLPKTFSSQPQHQQCQVLWQVVAPSPPPLSLQHRLPKYR